MKSTRTAAEQFVISERELSDLVLEQMETAIVICDKQMDIVLANPAAQTLCGGDPVGQSYDKAFNLRWMSREGQTETHREEAGAPFSLAPALEGETLRGRCILDRPGEEPRDVMINTAPYRGPQDEILCCIVSMTDVTEQKKQEQSQMLANTILNAVVEGTTDGIFVKDASGRYLMMNQAGAGIISRPVDQIVGKRDLDVFDADTAHALRADDQRIMQRGVPETVENILPTARGNRIFHSVKAPYRNGAGEIVGITGVSRDMTDLREAQAGLARQAALLDLTPDAMIVRTVQGKILLWNQGAVKLYGWTAEEALNNTTHFFLDSTFPESLQAQERSLLEHDYWEGELAHRTRSGQTVLVFSRQVLQRDEQGQPLVVLEINEDITERRQAERAKDLISQAGAILSSSLDFTETLENIARLAVPPLADWCAVHTLSEDGMIRRLAFAHHDPTRVARILERPQQYPLDQNAKHLVSHVLATGQTEFYNEVPDTVLQQAARDNAHLETLTSLGLKAYLCIPLQARGHTLGTVTFAMSDSGRRYSASDVELAHELVRRAGLAADNARLFQASQAAQERLQLVAEVSSELNASLDSETQMQRLAHLIVPRFADWCAINLLEKDGSIRLAVLSHTDAEMVSVIREWAAREPLDPDAPAGTPNVVRTGIPEWVPNVEPSDVSVSSALPKEHHATFVERVQARSYMIVPLGARGNMFGSITFVHSESGRHFRFEDLLIGEEMARRASIAMDNALLFAREQNARRQAEGNESRIATLQNITAALATALTEIQVARVVLERGLDALGANVGTVSILNADRDMIETLGAIGYPDEIVQAWRAYPLDTVVPIADAIREGETIIIEEESNLHARYPVVKERQPDLIGKSWAAIPLVLEGHVLGALGMTFSEPRHLDAPDIAFMNALAQQAAQAMERARLYQAEQTARAAAEQNASRLGSLQRITAALAPVLTSQQVSQVVLEQGIKALSAQGGIVARLKEDSETIEILGSVGYPEETINRWREFSKHSGFLMADAIRNGQAMIFESEEALLSMYPARAGRVETFGSRMVLPLEIKGKILGGLIIAFTQPRTFSEADRALATALARQCAQALERARLYESELAARQTAERAARRSQWLMEASHLLASSLDYEDTFRELARLVVPSLGDWCSIDMAKGDGTAEQLVLAHQDPEKMKWARDFAAEIQQYFTPDWDAPRGLPQVLRTGKSEIYYDIPDSLLAQVAKNEVQLNILRSIGYSSVMIVPLNAGGKTLGAITLVNTESRRHFDDDDLAFAELLASRAAVAIENARLYRDLQSLNAELEKRVEQRTFELSEAYDDLSIEIVERTRAEEMTRALLRISSKLNSTLDVESTLDILIQEAIRVMEGSAGFAGLRVEGGMEARKFYENGISVPVKQVWEIGKGMPGWVLKHRAPYVTNDAPTDPVILHHLPFNQSVQAAICTPILDAEGEVLGFFEVRDKTNHTPFVGADVEFLTALSPIASIAIQNAQAYQKLSEAEGTVKESYAQLRALAARLQTIREEERTDIARELHDELGQALTALKMDLAALIGRLPKRSKVLHERAAAMIEQIDATIKTVRRLSSQLRPGMLDDLGLGPSMEWYGQEFQARTGIEVAVAVPPEDLPITHTQATALFRIYQETLTNVARHAKASHVQVILTAEPSGVILQVIDDGQGFDMNEVRVKRSLGLLGMRERAEMVRGTLEILGEPGKGTIITIRVPI